MQRYFVCCSAMATFDINLVQLGNSCGCRKITNSKNTIKQNAIIQHEYNKCGACCSFDYLNHSSKMVGTKQYLCNFMSLITKKTCYVTLLSLIIGRKFIIYQSLVCLATLWTTDQILF